jgi:putative transposase
LPNTYTQLNIQAVFSMKGRENFLLNTYRSRLFEYMAGILRNIGQYPLAVNGTRDHVHLFFELHPTKNISDIMEVVKSNSSKWINENHFILGKFHWQSGYGAFSYSHSQRDDVIQYIMNQEKHHKQQSFREEYLEYLKMFEIQYNSDYLFEFYD